MTDQSTYTRDQFLADILALGYTQRTWATEVGRTVRTVYTWGHRDCPFPADVVALIREKLKHRKSAA